MFKKYYRPSEIINALQYKGRAHFEDLEKFLNLHCKDCSLEIYYQSRDSEVSLKTDQGVYNINTGDYIIKDSDGNISACRKAIFEKLYETTWPLI